MVTNPYHPAYLGAHAFTNNTAELTALSKTLCNLITQADTLPSGRGIIRHNSELAAACAMCIVTPARNRELVAEVHRLYTILCKNAPSRGDTCADTAITNGMTTSTTSPISAEGDSETFQPRWECGKTKPPKPRTPHLQPHP